MSPLLPLTRFKTLKNKSMQAIVLAILLHILIATIIYFSVFYKSPSIVIPTAKVDYQQTTVVSKTKSDDNTPSEDSEESTSEMATVRDANKNKEHDSIIDADHNASNRVSNIDVEPTSTPVLGDSSINTVKSMTDEPVDQPEYKLKQTQEYQRLDADINKDSEQLSKLINEIKQRNQSQIEKHHLPETTLKLVNSTASVPHDYPITPTDSQ